MIHEAPTNRLELHYALLQYMCKQKYESNGKSNQKDKLKRFVKNR